MTATRSQIMAALDVGPTWLLEISVGGREWRFADRQVEVTTRIGESFVFAAGLEPLELAVDGTMQAQTVRVFTDEDGPGIDPDALSMEWGRGTLRRWWPGQLLEEAEIITTGVLEEPEYGTADEAVVITIAPEWEDGQTLLDPLAVLDDVTMPINHDQSPGPGESDFVVPARLVGQAYPFIIGYPGNPPSGATVPLPAVPALLYSYGYDTSNGEALPECRVLLAGHREDASTAWLYLDGDVPVSEDRAVHYGADSTGRSLAYVDLDAVVTIDVATVTETSQFWTGYAKLGSYGGGSLGRNGQILRGAGDVAEWAMLQDGMRVDFGRMSAAKAYLNRYLVDTYINDPAEKAWPWLESEILRLLPVVVLESSEGKYLRVVHWRPTARDVVAHLDADRGQVDREGGILVVEEERRNRIEVRYRGAFGARWNSRVVLSAEADPNDSRVLPNEFCRRSQAQLRGVRGPKDDGSRPHAVDGSWVWTDSTAYRIASDMAARFALAKRSARYVGGWDLETIKPWDVVTVTDSEVGLTGTFALVQQRVLLRGQIALDLLLLPSA